MTRSDRGWANPVGVSRSKARGCLEPGLRISSGPAVMRTALKGRTHDCCRLDRHIPPINPLAPQAPFTQAPRRVACCDARCCSEVG